MNTFNKTFIRVVASFLLTLLALPAFSQVKPRWVSHNVNELNKARLNSSYEFVKVDGEGIMQEQADKAVIEKLANHFRETFQLGNVAVEVDSLGFKNFDEASLEYRFVFKTAPETVVYVKEIHEYLDHEIYADQTIVPHVYKLYAVGTKVNEKPLYDDISITNKVKGSTKLSSFVPGLAQLKKGSTMKGVSIIGLEATMIASAIAFQSKYNYSKGRDTGAGTFDSWRSKARSWREMRNIAIGLAGVIYVVNVIDGMVAKAAPYVKINRNKKESMAIAPMLSTQGTGVSFVLKF